MKKLFLLTLLLIVSIHTYSSSKNYNITKIPTWVNHIDSLSIDLSQNPHSTLSTRYLLVDQQVNLKSESSYYHYSRKILNEEGLSSESKLSFEFDPLYQTLNIHSISLIRNNKIIDKLKADKIEVIQREEGHEKNLYSGTLTAMTLLDDIRIGDIIDFEYTVNGFNPAYKNKFSDFFRLSWGTSVDLVNVQVYVPKNKIINYSNINTTEKPSIKENDNFKIYTWNLKSTEEVVFDDNIPSWYDVFSYVMISEYKSWEDVIDTIYGYYNFEENLSKELSEKITEIKSISNNEEEQILNTIRFVQDEINYLGLEYGINGYKPTSPNLVFERKFGDCKDKAFLFCIILRELGFEANPFLVNSRYRDEIKKWLPSVISFDHVICKFNYLNKDYFVDLTSSLQGGGINDLVVGNFKSGIVIKKGTKKLETLPTDNYVKSKIKSYETYNIKDFESPVSLNLKTIYSGHEADLLRSSIKSYTNKSLSQNYLKYVSKFYKSVETNGDLKIKDNRLKNTITITEKYIINNFWDKNHEDKLLNQTFYPLALYSDVPNIKTSIRNIPYPIAYPKNLESNLKVFLPAGWNLKYESKKIDNESFNYSSESNYSQKIFTVKYNYNAKKSYIPIENFKKSYNDIEEINNDIGDSLSYPMNKRFKNPNRKTTSNIVLSDDFSINWLFLTFILLSTVLIIYLIVKLYQKNFFIKKIIHIKEIDHNFFGIKDWLVLLWIINIGSLIFHIINTKNYYYLFNQYDWNKLTLPNSEFFNFYWAPTLILECFFILLLIALYTLLNIAFYQKKRFVPRLMIIIFSLIFLFNLLDYFFILNINLLDSNMIQKKAYEAFISFFSLIILTSYFINSKRVKNTFIY